MTINSLFYNINTREVEDFTGKGLDDLLEHKLIRTPLPPSETFRDGELDASQTHAPTHCTSGRSAFVALMPCERMDRCDMWR